MKFWQLVSICGRPVNDPLEIVFNKPEWSKFREWYRNFDNHIIAQDRVILDSMMPVDLVHQAMRECDLRFVVRNCHLYQAIDELNSLSALEAFTRFGGAALEDVLEKGACRVLPAKQSAVDDESG